MITFAAIDPKQTQKNMMSFLMSSPKTRGVVQEPLQDPECEFLLRGAVNSLPVIANKGNTEELSHLESLIEKYTKTLPFSKHQYLFATIISLVGLRGVMQPPDSVRPNHELGSQTFIDNLFETVKKGITAKTFAPEGNEQNAFQELFKWLSNKGFIQSPSKN